MPRSQSVPLLFSALAALLVFKPASVNAQSVQAVNDGVRIAAGLQFGFGGELSADVFEADLDPTIGVQAQVHFPIGTFVLVGGGIAFRSLKVDGVDDRGNLMAFAPSIAAHYAFDAGPLVLDPFALVSVGFAVAFDNDLLAETEFGVDFALRFGANLWFTDVIGAYLSMGYQREDIFADPENLSAGQFHMDLGAVFSL